MPAIILHHTSSPVKFDLPPVTAESVHAAKVAAALERFNQGLPLLPGDAELLELPTEAEWERLAVINGLDALIRSFGAQTVMDYIRGAHREDWAGLGYLIATYGHERIVRYVLNLAALHGQEVR